MSALSNARHQFSLAFRIAEESSESTGIYVFAEHQEVFFIEFEFFWKQVDQLVHTIEELKENG